MGKASELIFALDTKIRYVGIFSDKGEIIEMGMRKGVPSLTPEDIDRVVLPVIAGIGSRLSEFAGRLKRVIMDYEKVRLVFFPSNKWTVVVSLEADAPTSLIDKLALEVKKMER